MSADLKGIYAASITPFDARGKPDQEQLVKHLHHLKKRGCHGVLIGGTTGEAQSLSVEERLGLARVALEADAGLQILVGTGAASLEDAITLTRAAFDGGAECVVVIPPFFFKNAPLEGVRDFYSDLVRRAMPSEGKMLLYHNPVTTSTAVSLELIRWLTKQFPQQVIGVKDSSSDWTHTQRLCEEFPGFRVLVGDDRYLADTLNAGGVGAITGLSNVYADLLVEVYNLHAAGRATADAQGRLTATHGRFDGLPRLPALKAILTAGGVITNPAVRPPLRILNEVEMGILKERFNFGLNLGQIIDLDSLRAAL